MCGAAADGGDTEARSTRLDLIEDVAVAPDGSVYLTQWGRLSRVDPSGDLTTIMEDDERAFGAVTVDRHENVFFTVENSVFGLVDGDVRRVAGEVGTLRADAGFRGNPGPASTAWFHRPRGLDVDPEGNLLVADTFNDRVRRISPSWLCGNGVVDADEECDAGRRRGLYPCCTSDCRLRPPGTRCARGWWSRGRCTGASFGSAS